MTGTYQIYANPRQNSVYNRFAPKQVVEDPNLGPRLDKVLKESLDPRTAEFLNSLKSWFNTKGSLSLKQFASFERIESRFSPGEKAKLLEWKEEYASKHLHDAKILAQYYLKTGYWTHMATHIIETEGYIPPKTKYEKMSSNKYALAVLKNYKDVPRFDQGSMVQVRSNVGTTYQSSYLRPFKNRLGFVVQHNTSTLSAVKGGKGYTILLTGEMQPLALEERHLMKPNKKGKTA